MNDSVMWRMPNKCTNCPFHSRGPGRELARSLRRGRLASIKRALLRGEHFHCHKTTGFDDDDDDDDMPVARALICAGAIEYQDAHGVEPTVVQVMRRLDRMRA
jgi:hypothetical protein